MEKLKERGLEINLENEKLVREDLRKEFGMGAFAHILLPKIKELSKCYNVVIDGLYSWDEYKILKDNLENFYLIAIVCDKNIRYQRLEKRQIRSLSFSEANKRDIAEIENLAKGGPISYADYFVFNNGSIEEYQNRLEEIIKKIENGGK